MPPTGDLARHVGMGLDWELNQERFGSQAGTQSTEPHQPGHNYHFYLSNFVDIKKENEDFRLF